jgi:hypothetical protein
VTVPALGTKATANISLTAAKVGPRLAFHVGSAYCPAGLDATNVPYAVVAIRNTTVGQAKVTLEVSLAASQAELAVYTTVPAPANFTSCTGFYNTYCGGAPHPAACLAEAGNEGILVGSNQSLFALIEAPTDTFSGPATLAVTTNVGF